MILWSGRSVETIRQAIHTITDLERLERMTAPLDSVHAWADLLVVVKYLIRMMLKHARLSRCSWCDLASALLAR